MTIKINENRLLSFDAQSVLELSAKERISFIDGGIWITYPKVDKVLKVFKRLINQPKRTRTIGRLIIGPTGVGKTSLEKEFEFQERTEQGYSLDEPFYDIMHVEMPEVPSVKALYTEIGAECNLTHLRGTTEQLKQIIIETLNDLGVRMLFIDEIQNLVESQNERILNQCRNALRGLSNRLQIPIILMGTEKAENPLVADKMVASRYPIIRLTCFDYEEDHKEFLKLLMAFEKELPLREPSNLHDDAISELIYSRTGGLIGDIAYLINECAVIAIESGTERITEKIINNWQTHESI